MLNFSQKKTVIPYDMFMKFKESYYHEGSGEPNAPSMSYSEWSECPIFVFDCSRQNEAIKTSSVDVRLEFQTSESVPAATAAYCIIIHDNISEYNPLNGIVTKNL